MRSVDKLSLILSASLPCDVIFVQLVEKLAIFRYSQGNVQEWGTNLHATG